MRRRPAPPGLSPPQKHLLSGALKPAKPAEMPEEPPPVRPEQAAGSVQQQQVINVTMARIQSSVASHPGSAPRTPSAAGSLLGSPLLNPSSSPPDEQQSQGSWVEREQLLAMIFGGFPHLPCSHSQDVGDVRSLVRIFSAFTLCLEQQQQVGINALPMPTRPRCLSTYSHNLIFSCRLQKEG